MYTFNPSLFNKNLNFEFFFGAWNCRKEEFDLNLFIKKKELLFHKGENYFLLSSTFWDIKEKKSLISIAPKAACDLEALIFRGYILEPPFHSLSDRRKILAYWTSGFKKKHNGVFAFAGIYQGGESLVLISDAFGIGSLYYRKIGQTVLFASSPRLLSFEGDHQNLLAWRSLMEAGFILGDQSLSAQVFRVPPGTMLTFNQNKEKSSRWFDFTSLPEGNYPISQGAVDRVEQTFSKAMQRCISLNTSHRLLPLSSGYDSRHILSHLLSEKVLFTAQTVRVPDKEGLDSDAFLSGKLSQAFGFPHKIHDRYAFSDMKNAHQIRKFCFDSESQMHDWFLPVWEAVKGTTLVLEGLCGDTLSHSGLKISGVGEDYVPCLKTIAEKMIPSAFETILSSKWPSNRALVSSFQKEMHFLPKTNNLIDMVVMLHRARRAISISSQQFSRPGHIVVYPYLDMEYIQQLMRYQPLQRLKSPFQKKCLKDYHLKVFNYGQPHGDPINAPKLKRNCQQAQWAISKRMNEKTFRIFMKNLRLRKSVPFLMFKVNRKYLQQCHWWVSPMMEFSERHLTPSLIVPIKP